MPKHGHDYSTAKILHAKGLSIKQISDNTGIPYPALVKHAQRNEWDKNLDKAVQSLSNHVQADLSRTSESHVRNVVKLGLNRINSLLDYDFEKAVQGLDAEGYLRCFDMLDKILRRSLRLDEQAALRSSNLAVQVNIGHTAPVQGQILDATIIEDAQEPK